MDALLPLLALLASEDCLARTFRRATAASRMARRTATPMHETRTIKRVSEAEEAAMGRSDDDDETDEEKEDTEAADDEVVDPDENVKGVELDTAVF